MPAPIVKHVWAMAGTVAMPGNVGPIPVPVWGYAPSSTASQVPGTVIEATVGDDVEVILHNTLAEPVSMIFPGQQCNPKPVKDAMGRFVSFDQHAEPGGSMTYSFTAERPGTYRYESGTNPGIQVQMGLFGTLIVRPAGYDPADPATWTAYGPHTLSGYDREQLIILGEVDSALHAAVHAGLPYDLLNYAPDWWTINGRSFPDTLAPDAPSSSLPLGARITAAAGERILLRCINAGFWTHALHLGGLAGRVVAVDGWPLTNPSLDATYEKHTLTIAPGQIYDVVISPPSPGEFYLYDRQLFHIVNEGQFPGGMMTRLEVNP